MSLGSQIKKYRDLAGWRLEDLSERSGVDVGTINALENRKSDRSKYGIALAKAFSLSLEQLLDESKTFWPPGDNPGVAESISSADRIQMPTVIWPFKRVSYNRIKELQRMLGRADAHLAIVDIDKHIEIVVEKWEREAAHGNTRSAA